MKLLGLIGLLLLLLALLLPAGHRARHQGPAWQLRQRGAPVQVIRSPWAARAPKIVRPVRSKGAAGTGRPHPRQPAAQLFTRTSSPAAGP